MTPTYDFNEIEEPKAPLEYSEDEAYVNGLIIEAMQGIESLNGRQLRANRHELAAAVHVLQNFVRQAACHRLGLFGASDWWTDREEPT